MIGHANRWPLNKCVVVRGERLCKLQIAPTDTQASYYDCSCRATAGARCRRDAGKDEE